MHCTISNESITFVSSAAASNAQAARRVEQTQDVGHQRPGESEDEHANGHDAGKLVLGAIALQTVKLVLLTRKQQDKHDGEQVDGVGNDVRVRDLRAHVVVVFLDVLALNVKVPINRLRDHCRERNTNTLRCHSQSEQSSLEVLAVNFEHEQRANEVGSSVRNLLKKRDAKPEPLAADHIPDREHRWNNVEAHDENLREDNDVAPVPRETVLLDQVRSEHCQECGKHRGNTVVDRLNTSPRTLDRSRRSHGDHSKHVVAETEGNVAVDRLALNQLVQESEHGLGRTRRDPLFLNAEPAERQDDERHTGTDAHDSVKSDRPRECATIVLAVQAQSRKESRNNRKPVENNIAVTHGSASDVGWLLLRDLDHGAVEAAVSEDSAEVGKHHEDDHLDATVGGVRVDRRKLLCGQLAGVQVGDRRVAVVRVTERQDSHEEARHERHSPPDHHVWTTTVTEDRDGVSQHAGEDAETAGKLDESHRCRNKRRRHVEVVVERRVDHSTDAAVDDTDASRESHHTEVLPRIHGHGATSGTQGTILVLAEDHTVLNIRRFGLHVGILLELLRSLHGARRIQKEGAAAKTVTDEGVQVVVARFCMWISRFVHQYSSHNYIVVKSARSVMLVVRGDMKAAFAISTWLLWPMELV
ncbi:hypothetical protein ON010_g11318 [Phytophthora cinnamomi]|nr:hypothetical protein ON010_g11318 [Phytophthora cinnamomi]